jgi:hypothetical protein
MSTPALGAPVSVVRGGTNPRCRYPVEAVVELFATVVFTDGPSPAAVLRVTADTGLYREGDLFIARVSELEPAEAVPA